MLTLMALLLAVLLGPGPIHADFNGSGPPGAPVVAADVGGGGPAGNAATNGDVLTPPGPIDDVGGGGPAGH